MKKMMVVGMIAVVMAIGFLDMAVAEEMIISGYKSGEFAVKGEVEQEMMKVVKAIQAYSVQRNIPQEIITSSSRIKAEAGRLLIKVIGSADSSGVSSINDRLSKDRAEAVAAELVSFFPEARITIVPKGDQDNLRQVKVEYQIVLSMVSQPLTKKQPFKKLERRLVYRPASYLLAASIIAFAFFAMLAFLFLRRPKQQVLVPQPQSPSTMKSTEPAEAWICFGDNHKIKLVKIISNDSEKWEAPFVKGKGTFVSYPDLGEAKRQLEREKTQQYFAGQLNNLLAEKSDRVRWIKKFDLG